MTIDQFIIEHEPTWNRLADMTFKMRDANQAVDFVQFADDLEAAQTHLNIARTQYNDGELINRLSLLCAHAGRAAHRNEPLNMFVIKRWFIETFPAAFWSLRYWMLISAIAFIGSAVVCGLWLHFTPEALDTFMDTASRKIYVEREFVDYYTKDPSALFFAEVTTNNIGVAALTFGSGMFLALPTVMILAYNGLTLGGAWAVFAEVNQTSTFWLHIAPHGFMELFAIMVAGGAGMAVGWTWIDPGPRSRTEAIADIGQRAVTVVIGVAIMLLVAGLIEGFVTGATFPILFKAIFGFIVWAGFTGTLVYLGWLAGQKGLDGSLKQANRVEFSMSATTTYTRY